MVKFICVLLLLFLQQRKKNQTLYILAYRINSIGYLCVLYFLTFLLFRFSFNRFNVCVCVAGFFSVQLLFFTSLSSHARDLFAFSIQLNAIDTATTKLRLKYKQQQFQRLNVY